MIRKRLGIRQQQLAEATNLTQPTVSRLENGEEVFSSALLAVLGFYQDKISLDCLFDPDSETDDEMLCCSRHEIRQKLDHQLAVIANGIDDSLKKIAALRNKI